jgi:hypothetical protein
VLAADISDYADGEPLTADREYPLGELLQDTTTGGVYYAESGIKHPLYDAALLKLNFPGRPILPAGRASLDTLTTGSAIRFPDGTLLKTASDPRVYLISSGTKRPFAAERDFRALGFRFANVKTVNTKALSLHETGDTIDLGLPDPTLATMVP